MSWLYTYCKEYLFGPWPKQKSCAVAGATRVLKNTCGPECGTIAAQALKSSILEEAHHPKHRDRSLSVCLPLGHVSRQCLWQLPKFCSSRYNKVGLFFSVQVSAKECISNPCSVDCKPHLNRKICFTKSNVCGTIRIYYIIWITVTVSLLQTEYVSVFEPVPKTWSNHAIYS